MSVNSRGQFGGPASVPRDFGLLQAPRTSLRPYHDTASVEGDAHEQAEFDEARRALDRFEQTGQTFDPAYAPVSPPPPPHHHHQQPHHHAAAETGSSASVAPSASSREPSIERPASVSAHGSTRPITMPRRGSNIVRRSSTQVAASYSSTGSNVSRRFRDLVLGGEAPPPPLEQAQQQYLNQHPPHHATAGTTAGGPTGSERPQPQYIHAPRSRSQQRPSSARPWSRSSNEVVPRWADVAQVRQQIRRRSSGVVPLDIERASAQTGERTPLLNGIKRSHSSSVLAESPGPSAAAPSTSTSPEDDTDSITSSEESFEQAIPGPGAGKEEAQTLGSYTIPILGTHMLELSLSVVVVFAIGHLGTIELAASSLASMTCNVTGFSIITGFVSALDSTLPAAAASTHPEMVGIWTQRMIVLITALSIPIIVLWSRAEWILLLLKQDPDVSALAAGYLLILTLAIPAFGAFEIMRRYLQALGLFHAPTIAVGVASAFNVPAQLLLVYGPERIRIGFYGAAWGSVASYYVLALFGAVQCWLAPRDAWNGLSWKALDAKGLWELTLLSISSTIAIMSEWWAWEIVQVIASVLGTSALAAQSVLLVTCSMTYQIPMSVSVAAAVRVGNLLGANQPYWAKLSVRTSMWGALICGCFNSAAMFLFRNSWGWMFSSDPALVSRIAQILPYVAAFQIADGICGVGAGILRGCGRPGPGSIANLVAYYAVGLPLGSYLMLSRNWGLEGIWMGLSIGVTVGAAGFLVLIFRTDWNAETERVQARMEEELVSEDEAEDEVESILEQQVGDSQHEDDEDSPRRGRTMNGHR